MSTQKPVMENTGNLDFFSKTQGVLFAQVVNPVFQKVKDIVIFATKFSFFRSLICLSSQFSV